MSVTPSDDISRVWSAKLQSAQDCIDKAVRLEFSRSYAEAFATYLKGAEQYLWLVRNISDRPTSAAEGVNAEVQLRNRLKAAGAKALDRAEKIKKVKKDIEPIHRRALSDEEQSRVLQSAARVGAVSLPVWTPPTDEDFRLPPIFNDPEPQPALSKSQQVLSAEFDRRYKRRPSMRLYDHASPLRGRDIVQDVVTDCSVVTALEVAAEHDRRWGTKLSTQPLYPKDASGHLALPSNGRYELKLHINGCDRRITIDESLPTTPDGVIACAASRLSDQYWPSLVEKGYLKVMGGYEFLGSNSSVDLHALTGWIPEQVFLQHAGIHREKLWTRLWEAWRKGKCLLTIGTGDLDDETAAQRGLVPSHNYAVLDLREEGHDRLVTLMNPWRRDDSARLRNAPFSSSAQWMNEIRSALQSSTTAEAAAASKAEDNTFTVTWESLCAHFDTIYVNWDPAILNHRLVAHSTWEPSAETAAPTPIMAPSNKSRPSSRPSSASARPSSADPDVAVGQAWASGQNPQFKLSVGAMNGRRSSRGDNHQSSVLHSSPRIYSTSDVVATQPSSKDTHSALEVWLLLVRHASDQMCGPDAKKNEFIALHVFEKDGSATTRQALKPSSRAKFGTYVDGLTTFVRLSLTGPNASLTVVASRHGAPQPATFSLYAYAAAPMSLEELPRTHPHRQQITGAWTTQNAGGNVSHATFMDNPQYKIAIPAPTSKITSSKTAGVLFLLEAPRTLPVQAILTWSPGKRVTSLSSNDIVASSGAYQHGLAFLEVPAIQPGTYTLIVSSFEAGREGTGPYVLMMESSMSISCEPIPPEGAGMFLRSIRGEWASPERLAILSSSTSNTTLAIGAAAGSPKNGEFSRNPTVLVRLPGPAPVRLQVRMRVDGSTGSPRPYINVAIFGAIPRRSENDAAPSSFALGHELYSSGPYADHVSGAAIDFKSDARLGPGTYLIVASTFSPGVLGKFKIDVWSEHAVEVRALE